MTREDLEGNSGVGLCSDTCVGAASEATRSSSLYQWGPELGVSSVQSHTNECGLQSSERERGLTRMPSNRDRARSGRRARSVRRALIGAMSEYSRIFAVRLVSDI